MLHTAHTKAPGCHLGPSQCTAHLQQHRNDNDSSACTNPTHPPAIRYSFLIHIHHNYTLQLYIHISVSSSPYYSAACSSVGVGSTVWCPLSSSSCFTYIQPLMRHFTHHLQCHRNVYNTFHLYIDVYITSYAPHSSHGGDVCAGSTHCGALLSLSFLFFFDLFCEK